MKLHSFKAKCRKGKKRVGRGISSGYGKTCGRGQKGQLSRSGGGKGPGFEGGQTPLQRRVPKLPGFKSPFKKQYHIINVEALNTFKSGSKVSPEQLAKVGLIKKLKYSVKVLGSGELKKALTVQAHQFSQSAEEKIKAAGGKVEIIK